MTHREPPLHSAMTHQHHALTEASISTLSFIFAKPNLVIPSTSPCTHEAASIVTTNTTNSYIVAYKATSINELELRSQKEYVSVLEYSKNSTEKRTAVGEYI